MRSGIALPVVKGSPQMPLTFLPVLAGYFHSLPAHRKLLFLKTLKLPLVYIIHWALPECQNFEGPKEIIRNLDCDLRIMVIVAVTFIIAKKVIDKLNREVEK